MGSPLGSTQRPREWKLAQPDETLVLVDQASTFQLPEKIF